MIVTRRLICSLWLIFSPHTVTPDLLEQHNDFSFCVEDHDMNNTQQTKNTLSFFLKTLHTASDCPLQYEMPLICGHGYCSIFIYFPEVIKNLYKAQGYILSWYSRRYPVRIPLGSNGGAQASETECLCTSVTLKTGFFTGTIGAKKETHKLSSNPLFLAIIRCSL